MKASNWARLSGKLIFYWVKKKEVPMSGTMKAGTSGSYLGR